MTDNFGQYADSVQGARVTFLKSERSIHNWHVRQHRLERAFLQLGIDGGAGVAHGVTDPNLTTLIMQFTNFDDRVSLDGVICASCILVILPPECHFAFVRTGPVKWLSVSMRKDESLALEISSTATIQHLHKTEKFLVTLQNEVAQRFRSAVHKLFDPKSRSKADDQSVLFEELENVWTQRASVASLPSVYTRSAERVVFRALRFVQSKPGQRIEIGDLAKAGEVSYRTLLRAFERYLKLSPKHYLKLRQINGVYHAIRRNDGANTLADILTAHGVAEFGRFAGEYKSIFDELPSSTYQRHHRGSNHVRNKVGL